MEQQMKAQMEQLQEQLQQQKAWQEAEIVPQLKKVQVRQVKQENLLEDIFEVIEEHGEAFEKKEEIRGKEQQLAKQLMEYDELISDVLRIFGEHEEMAETKNVMSALMEKKYLELQHLNLRKVGQTGDLLDYKVHDIAGVTVTTDMRLKDRVCQVITAGWSYEGVLQKKAKVTAYKYEEKKDEYGENNRN